MQTLNKNLCYLQSHRHIPRCVQCFLHYVAVKHICSKITCRLELFSVDESVVLFLKVLVEIDSSTSFLFTVQPPMYALCNNEEEEFSSCLATYTLWVLFFHFASLFLFSRNQTLRFVCTCFCDVYCMWWKSRSVVPILKLLLFLLLVVWKEFAEKW